LWVHAQHAWHENQLISFLQNIQVLALHTWVHEIRCQGDESLNDNLRLVLLTRGSK
jgi:hypothetical protein